MSLICLTASGFYRSAVTCLKSRRYRSQVRISSIMHKILHKVLRGILCAKALLRPSEPMTTSGTLDDARNRPNKSAPRFALAYKFRLCTHMHAIKFQGRRGNTKPSLRSRRRVFRIPIGPRSVWRAAVQISFRCGAVCKAGVGYVEPIAWLRRTHCMATQNPLHGYAEPIDNLNISFCRIRFQKSKISPCMKATAGIQIIEIAAPRDDL